MAEQSFFKQNIMKHTRSLRLLFVLGILAAACHKININNNDLRDFEQVNLVANVGTAGLTDPTLENAWGLAWAPSGIAWVNSQAGHVSELYTGAGAIVRPPVAIPAPGDTINGNPSGIVFNSTKGFILPDHAAASFIFVGVDGIVSAWNGAAGNRAVTVADNSAWAAYTGLALANNNGKNLLYAANFRTGKIDVWDTSWASVSLPFRDAGIPKGYAPFNIQSVGSWLYVAYARVGPDGRQAVGAGQGFVDIFNPDGSFVQRFASRGSLNAPWGVAMAAAGWLTTRDMSADDSKESGDNSGKGSNNSGPGNNNGSGKLNGGHGNDDNVGPVVLIGNFGDGRINVFAPSGQYLGQLQSHNRPIVIDGLWALGFAPSTATTIDPNRLYFTAGPDREMDGIFGYLIKN
jgi:uncharacterized protein (TIGR03118 family)